MQDEGLSVYCQNHRTFSPVPRRSKKVSLLPCDLIFRLIFLYVGGGLSSLKNKPIQSSMNVKSHAMSYVMLIPVVFSRCKEWVRLCGNEQILMLPAAKMPSRLYVCALHFSRQQYWSKYLDRLKSHNGGAVPDQLLGNPLSDELLDRWWKGETVESTTPSLHNSRTTNAEISKSKEMVSLFESSDKIKQSVSPGRLSCTSDHGNEGFLPMEYIDQADR